MAHLSLEKFDELEERIKLFDTEYLIAYENAKYEHYHFIVKITDKEYHNFCQEYFKKKYKLCGRAVKGQPRQYGKEKQIKDLDRSLIYTLKDGNYRTNMDKDYIKELYEKSFKKDNKKEKHMDLLFKHLDSKHIPYDTENYCNQYKVQYCKTNKDILAEIYYFILKNKDIELSLSRTAINNYFLKYLRTTQLYSIEEKIRMALFFNNHF